MTATAATAKKFLHILIDETEMTAPDLYFIAALILSIETMPPAELFLHMNSEDEEDCAPPAGSQPQPAGAQ